MRPVAPIDGDGPDREPMTPANCDLRDFSRMMIDVNRLFGSSFNASASRNPLAWMIGHKLWYRSWHQVPAASLPDDDNELCYLAELGFDLQSFMGAKTLAMRGWVKCSDGRLYHPVVAEAANAAWRSKLEQRWKTECARIKKHNQRHKTEIAFPDLEDFIECGCIPARLPVPGDKSGSKPQGSARAGVSLGTEGNVPRDKAMSLGTNGDVPGDEGQCPSGIEIQGKGKGRLSSVSKDTGAAAPEEAGEGLPERSVEAQAEDHLWEAGKKFLTRHGHHKSKVGAIIGKWKRDYGVANTIEAIGVAEREPNLVDAVSFIEKVLQRAGPGRGNGWQLPGGGTPLNSPC